MSQTKVHQSYQKFRNKQLRAGAKPHTVLTFEQWFDAMRARGRVALTGKSIMIKEAENED